MNEQKRITNRIAWAAMILTAARMGYKIGWGWLAKAILSTEIDLTPYEIVSLNKEAVKHQNKIARDKRTDEANGIAQAILKQYGY